MIDEKQEYVVPEIESLRTRIAKVLASTVCTLAENNPCDECIEPELPVADAVIAELDSELLDFGLWLSEELRGFQMNRQDLESCIKDWRTGHE